jgi:fermentation-respiration switch protein FrsA (DUF1100 family)
MGAVASLLAFPEAGSAVKAVVADSPYDDLQSSIGKHVRHFLHLPGFPFTDVFLWNLERRGHFNSDRFQPVNVLRSIRQVPMLFIFGADDRRMDSSVAENLYRATSSSKKSLHFFKGANHGAAFRTDPERYLLLIHNFIQSLD